MLRPSYLTGPLARVHTQVLEIWSIGHGARTADELVAMLDAAHIATVADIRSIPGSRRHPQFGAKALAATLAAAGIAYVHMPGLGGRREGRADSAHVAIGVPALRAYADHLGTKEFAAEYERLTKVATQKRVAFMCAERSPERCHRRILSDRLAADGWAVTHLLSPTETEKHAMTPAARVVDRRLVYDGGTLPLPR